MTTLDEPTQSPGHGGTSSGVNPLARGGVRVTRGAQVSIPAGGLTLRLDTTTASVTCAPVVVHIVNDMWIEWMEAAINNLKAAYRYRDRLVEAHLAGDETDIDPMLRAEMMASMQAVAASAFAIDSMSDSVSRLIEVPQQVLDSWRPDPARGKRTTARASQVMWFVRQTGKTTNTESKRLDVRTRSLFQARNAAVHADREPRLPLIHPVLQSGVEWRLATYTVENAEAGVAAALSILMHAFRGDKKNLSKRAQDWCVSCRGILSGLLDEHGVDVLDTPKMPPAPTTPSD